MDPATATTATKEVVQYEPNMFGSLMMIPVLFVIFYFFIIKPQSDREKKKKEMVSKMKRGDRVLTAGGIFGFVQDVKDDYVVIKISEQVKVEVSRESLTLVPEPTKQS